MIRRKKRQVQDASPVTTAVNFAMWYAPLIYQGAVGAPPIAMKSSQSWESLMRPCSVCIGT